MKFSPDQRTFVKRLCGTILIGLVGGAVFNFFSLPLAWVLGAMFLTTVAALAGAPVVFSRRLREVMSIVLGTLLGSAFSPEVGGQILGWWDGVVVSYIALLLMLVLGAILFRMMGRFDLPTSFFCATPGGLSVMTIVGEEMGGNPQIIPLVHAIRIVLVVFAIPAFLVFYIGMAIPDRGAVAALSVEMAGQDMLLVALGAGVGVFAGKLVRLPSATLIGPMLVTATMFSTGIVTGSPPFILVLIAQVIIGSSIGPRFTGLNVRKLLRPILLAMISASFMLAIAIVFANQLHEVIDVPMIALLLALAPGGLAEMCLIAISLDVDTAYVGSMHVARILFVVLLAPLVFKLVGRYQQT